MKTIWLNGCFDILHPGHIVLFKVSKSLGDRLIVGLDSDEKVRKDKGEYRPINCFQDRKTMLESIRYIDLVVGFNSNQELEELIEFYSPHILVDGSDWKHHEGVGRKYAKDVRFFNRVGGYSSSDIISRCKRASISGDQVCSEGLGL